MPAGRRAGSCQARRFSSAGLVLKKCDDVALLAAAELDADRIDQHQPVELRMAAGRELGGDPAAERKADHRPPRPAARRARRDRVARDRTSCRNPSGSGESPKPGCDGAMTSPCSASRSRNGACGLIGLMPWISRIGRRRPPDSSRIAGASTSTLERADAELSGRLLISPPPAPRQPGGLVRVDRRQVLQLRQHLPGREGEALLGLGVRHEALAGHHDDVADAADPLAELLDLAHHGVGIAGEHLALADQHFGVEIGRARPPRRAGAPCRRRHLGRDLAGLELGELRRALDADGQEPGDLLADPQRFLVGVADIGEGHVGKPVLAGRRQSGLGARLLVGVERLPRAVIAAEQQRVDDAAAAQFGAGRQIATSPPRIPGAAAGTGAARC